MYEVLIGFNVKVGDGLRANGELRFEAGDVVEKLPAEADVKSLLEAGAIRVISKKRGREVAHE